MLRAALVGIGLLSLVSGCATVFNGSTQGIGIASVPTGAAVSVDNIAQGHTPVIAPLSRKDNHIVKVEYPGYHPFEATLTRSLNGWVFGNILIGGLVGVSIDAISGAMYDLTPPQITANLVPLPQATVQRQAEPQPSVTDQPVQQSARTTAPQCADATIRVQCPLYQYRAGLYRGTCKDGSGVEVGSEYVKVLPPQMGNPPRPWQAEGCSLATAG